LGGENILSYDSDVEGLGHCIAEEADEVGDKGTENSTSVDVDTHLVALLENFNKWGVFFSCRSIRIFGGSAFRLK